jgi:peptidoglycan/LPS O-acetylase OafA/YrhL
VAIVAILVLASFVTFVVERPAMRWIRERWKNRHLRTSPQGV